MRAFWVLVERFRLRVFIGALAAPFIGAWLGARLRRRVRTSSPRLGATALALGISAGTLLLPVLLFISMCTPPPGRGQTAEAWYARMRPAIDALDRYHRDWKGYPDSLAALVPRYMDSVHLSQLQSATGDLLVYRHAGSDYEMTFHYYEPGSNSCTFRASDRTWRCRGLFRSFCWHPKSA
jgi:hypothetical protein